MFLFPVVANSQYYLGTHTLFELAMVEKLNFVALITLRLIFDSFHQVSQHERKISPV